MKKASFILGIGLSMAFTATSAARIFTDLEGREIDAELVSATDTKVVLKLKKNRKTYTLDIAKFSEEDIEFIEERREEFLPGDVLELKAAKFSNGQKSGPEHTAIIMKQGRRKGQMTVYHQNWGKPGKIVSELDFDLKELQSGEAIVYRYGRR
ncbi:hypothetical protein OAF67_00515 [Akkermansiaceae bacterium]|nr:hypothetical protein [Akkermansiaceae bacterium]